jgi:hypothetical protein
VLERRRGTGDGPEYLRFSGKTIRGLPGDLDGFAARSRRTSTAG